MILDFVILKILSIMYLFKGLLPSVGRFPKINKKIWIDVTPEWDGVGQKT